MTISPGGAARALIGVVISVVTLFVILRGVNLALVGDILRTATPAWVVLMLACVVIDLTFRAIRWQRLLAPVHHVPIRRTYLYLLVGYLANNVLPARLGELVRCHYLGDREGVSRTTALGTVVVERVIDTAVVVSIASLSIVILQVRGLVASAVLFGLAITSLGVVVLAGLVVVHRLPGAERLVALAERWPRAAEIGRKLHGGLAVAARPRTLFEALAMSGLAWGATIISFAAAGQALGVQLSTAQAALLVSGVALATAIPAGPGNLGTFDLAGVLIASSFGIDREKAVALVVLAHAASIIVTSVGGAGALLRLGWAHRPPAPISEAEVG
jgi:glycosyltransferase 2 family protein